MIYVYDAVELKERLCEVESDFTNVDSAEKVLPTVTLTFMLV